MIPNQQSANKRIIINTLFIYFRMFASLFISLYTSRIVLQVLGVSDFGIYGVVGGVLAMFTFIKGSLGAATNRFFNTEMGKKDGDVNKIFNVNQALHFCLALIIFILAETIGLWYVYHKLNVAEGKLDDAVFVYQICIITTCLGINNGPYSCVFTANEKFQFLTTFEIANMIFRFFLVLSMQFYHGNALRLYAIIMSLTTVNTFVVYHWLAIKRWPEVVKFKIIKGWENYSPVLSFGGWNLLSTVSFMARSSGSDLLLNSFFGTAVNGAYAISRHVNSQISSFSTTFDVASGPQIVQAYSGKNYERCYYLANKIGRISVLLFELAFFPVYIELPLLLELWLGDVPDGVLTFTRFNLIICGMSLTCGGFNQIISASGKIKWFKIEISAFFLLCVPAGYLLFKFGYPPYSMLVLFLIADILQRGVQMILLKTILNFDSIRYMREAWLKPALIGIIMSIVLYVYHLLEVNSIWIRITSIIVCFCISAILIYKIGLTPGEKSKVKNKIFKKLHLSGAL